MRICTRISRLRHRLAHFHRRNHLHRLGHFLGVGDGLDAALDYFGVDGHI